MHKIILLIVLYVTGTCMNALAGKLEKDTINTSGGNIIITFIGHGTLMFEYDGKVIHLDPTFEESDYSDLPKADIILVTHHHGDHFDKSAIEKLTKQDTKIVFTKICSGNGGDFKNATILKNDSSTAIDNIQIEAVPAYNIQNKRPNGNPFHVKGEGNGYIVTFGGKRVYVAGDTENTPEMKSLRNVDIAFLPMNLPYTMTPEMVADAAKAFKPKVLYPYHYGETDTNQLIDLLKNNKEIEIRIRQMK